MQVLQQEQHRAATGKVCRSVSAASDDQTTERRAGSCTGPATMTRHLALSPLEKKCPD